MIIDARIVIGDNDVFLANYEELSGVVDMFLVFEPLVFFSSGQFREPMFKHSRLDKVVYFSSSSTVNGSSVDREHWMRRELMTNIVRAVSAPGDIVTVLDGDEILRREKLLEAVAIVQSGEQMVGMRMPTSNLFANWVVRDVVHKWPKVARASYITSRTFHDVRWDTSTPHPLIHDSGWHLSHCGGRDSFVNKWRAGRVEDIASAKYERFVTNRITTFRDTPPVVMPVEFLPRHLQSDSMRPLFFKE